MPWQVPGVVSFDRVRARRMGPQTLVDLTIQTDDMISASAAQQVAHGSLVLYRGLVFSKIARATFFSFLSFSNALGGGSCNLSTTNAFFCFVSKLVPGCASSTTSDPSVFVPGRQVSTESTSRGAPE